jgi:hypothetical protein
MVLGIKNHHSHIILFSCQGSQRESGSLPERRSTISPPCCGSGVGKIESLLPKRVVKRPESGRIL